MAYEIEKERHAEQLTVVPIVLSAAGAVPQTMHASETSKPERRDFQKLSECISV